MKHERNAARSRRIPQRGLALALVLAVLLTGLVLWLSYLNAGAAEHYLVTVDGDGAYVEINGERIPVSPVEDIPDGNEEGWLWQIQSLTVGENQDTYQDESGNWYYPDTGDTCTLTLKAVDAGGETGLLLAPTEVGGDSTVLSCTVAADGTVLELSALSLDGFSVSSIQAKDLPDENGVVGNSAVGTWDQFYCQTDAGVFARMPVLRIEEPMVDDFADGQLYGQSSEGTSLFYGWFIPGQLELTLTDDHLFITDVLPQVTDGQYNLTSLEFRDEHTLVLSSTDWTDVIQVKITGLNTAALNGTVTEVTGDDPYYVDLMQVYPLGEAFAGWTVIVDGSSYQDAEGNCYLYVPSSASTTYNVTLKREGYWLPTEETSLYSTRFENGATIVIYTGVTATESGGVAVLPFAPPTVEAMDAPDAGNSYAAWGLGGGWYYSQDGTWFKTMPELRMEKVPNESISSQDLYGLYFRQVDGNYAYGRFVPGTTVTLAAASGYGFGSDNAVRDYPDAVTVTDARTITINTSGMENKTQVVMDMDIREDITVTFTPADYFTVWVDYEEASSVQWPQGVDMDISLSVDSGLFQVEDLQTAITGATVSAADTGEVAGEPLDLDLTVDRYGDATIPGDVLYADCTITFTVNEGAFTRLVTVPETRGEGYVLYCERGAVPGEPGYISLILAVDPAYIDDATPVLTPPEGWSIDYMGNELNLWYITLVYGDGETDPVPYEPMELTVGVSGIVPNYTPPEPDDGEDEGSGGGGSSGGSKEEIRVENQLNQEGASSDTKLWPNGTKEQNGVSTTTVTDKELEALINLAQQHIEDIKELDGDGYKEGIIVIEDLRPNSNIHTYILKLTESQFERISEEEWDRFTVQTPAGSLSLYGNTIREVAGLEGAVDFTIARLEYEGRPGADVTLTVDGKPVTTFSEVYGIRAFVPYVPAQEEDVNALLMDYIHEDGTVERVTESFYDETAGGVYVFTDHLSKFGVAYRPAVYTDVGADHWASPYVTFLAARGLLDTGSTFRPDDKATRGELLELLAEALSAANLPSRAVQVYSDVPTSSSLARAASWAYYNNLTSSIADGGRLRPNEAITREDMAALVGNVASGVGLRLRSKGLDTGYTDLGDVASYARASVTRLRSAGILEMPDNYKFSPKATLNRGEMAQIVATLLSSL